MKNIKVLILVIMLAASLLAGCASFSRSGVYRSDSELFDEGLSYLKRTDGNPDYIKAKMTLELLVVAYPKSKWRGLSETLVKLIASSQSCEEKNGASLKLIEKLQGEKHRLAKELEKHRIETAPLIQENEQLKKDLQQLKNLELQLEKRRERSGK